MKELLQRYSELKEQIRSLETEMDEVNGKISSEMDAEQVDKVESDFGTFYFTVRKSWTYSDAIEKLVGDLKEAKKAEEESGVATAEESKSLTFKKKQI